MGQFVSVVLEWAFMIEGKDRRVGVAMVVIMANDQGSVVVIPLVLCCVVLRVARQEYANVQSKQRVGQFVSVVLE